ncbi:hypothetical protein D6827_03070 [Candidatus Parcubacteria bacterium]|nr:MAG: hypothetical protein D6827_03070 [Candidatus Parcubacteria bacterium]
MFNASAHNTAAQLANGFFSFIPILPPNTIIKNKQYDGKTPPPSVLWRKYQKQLPAPSDWQAYFKKYPNHNIAIITGKISNLTVLDIDLNGASATALAPILKDIPNKTPIAITGAGGLHIYLPFLPIKTGVEYPINKVFPSLPADTPLKLDIRSEGGYVIAPPSTHKNGSQYIWHPMHTPLTEYHKNELRFYNNELKQRLLTLIDRQKNTPQQKNWQKIILSAHIGNRNNTATQIAGLLLKYLPPSHWQSAAAPLLYAWNKTFAKPPLSNKELETIINSIAKKQKRHY